MPALSATAFIPSRISSATFIKHSIMAAKYLGMSFISNLLLAFDSRSIFQNSSLMT